MYTLKSSASALVRELPSPMNLRKTGSGTLERFLEWRLRPNVELETLSYHTGIRAVASSVHQEASSCVKPDINFLSERVFVPRLRYRHLNTEKRFVAHYEASMPIEWLLPNEFILATLNGPVLFFT